MAQIKVKDEHGTPIPRINIRISEGDKGSDEAIFDVFTSPTDGDTGWPIPHWPPPQSMPEGHYTLHVNDRYIDPRFESRSVTKSHDKNATIVLERTPLTRLHVEGHYFVNALGARTFIKGNTDFLLYKKYLDGEDIGPLLAQRSAFGSNCVRVIGMVSSFAHWFPQEYGERYYTEIVPFCALLGKYGLYVYWTVFADTQVIMGDKVVQIWHFDRVVAELRKCDNAIGELVNEPYAHDNTVDDPKAFTRPSVVPFCAGSFNDKYGGEMPPWPRWDFHDYHTPRDAHKGGVKAFADQNMTVNPNWRKGGQPVISGEPQKFADPNDPTKGGSTLSDPEQAWLMARSALGGACGINFHTPGGVFSRPWNEIEQMCAARWFEALRTA